MWILPWCALFRNKYFFISRLIERQSADITLLIQPILIFELKTAAHYILRCQNNIIQRTALLNQFVKIRNDLATQPETNLL